MSMLKRSSHPDDVYASAPSCATSDPPLPLPDRDSLLLVDRLDQCVRHELASFPLDTLEGAAIVPRWFVSFTIISRAPSACGGSVSWRFAVDRVRVLFTIKRSGDILVLFLPLGAAPVDT